MKNKYYRENSKKAQAYLNSLKNKKWTLEDMKKQLQRTTPKEVPLNSRHWLLHFFLCTNDHAADRAALSKQVSVSGDKAYCSRLRLQLEKELRN